MHVMSKGESNEGEQSLSGSVAKAIDCSAALAGGAGVLCTIGNDSIAALAADAEPRPASCVQIEATDVQNLLNTNKNRLFYQV